MRKMGSFVYLLCLLPELWSLKCQTFSAHNSKKNCQSLGKVHMEDLSVFLQKMVWLLGFELNFEIL